MIALTLRWVWWAGEVVQPTRKSGSSRPGPITPLSGRGLAGLTVSWDSFHPLFSDFLLYHCCDTGCGCRIMGSSE